MKRPEKAMAKSRVLVRDYVRAGYTKIHLDTSMKCADDGSHREPLQRRLLPPALLNWPWLLKRRFRDVGDRGSWPLYVIGTEVPAPGGVDDAEEGPPSVTTPQAAAETIGPRGRLSRRLILKRHGSRVIAVVVQPGVEYGNDSLYEYDAAAAASLSRFIEGVDGVVFEAHSTDYQRKGVFERAGARSLRDSKSRTGLTFAFREAIFALAEIEEVLLDGRERPYQISAMLWIRLCWRILSTGSRITLAMMCSSIMHGSIVSATASAITGLFTTVEQSIDRLLANLSSTPIPLPAAQPIFARTIFCRARLSSFKHTGEAD